MNFTMPIWQSNLFPFFPILSCRKKTSPSPVNLKITAVITKGKEKSINANEENNISKNLCIAATSADLNLFLSLHDQNQVGF